MLNYFSDGETIYQYEDPREDLSFQELFAIYQPKMAVLKRCLADQKGERTQLMRLKQQSQDRLAALVPFKDLEVAVELCWAFTHRKRVAELDTLITQTEGLLRIQTHKSRASEVIAIPISDFMKFNSMGFGRCPFHGDQAPSMKYYKRDNRAHCFAGCGQKNVIQVYAQIKGLTTKEAFKQLVGTLHV